MCKMSEDEAIDILKNNEVLQALFNIKYEYKIKQAIETILDLYQQEKEKNKELLTGNIETIRKMLGEEFAKHYISKDKIKDMKRYREFELQQEYKDFENDIQWKTYKELLEEE